MKQAPLGISTRAIGPPRAADAEDFFREALRQLSRSRIPFLVGGTYGIATYLGLERSTKDLDVFVCPSDARRVLGLFRDLGYRIEFTFPHWLGKVYCGAAFMDVIFSSGNGVTPVDDQWFAHARDGVVLGAPVKLCAPEEVIWSKAFVQERERFDGADVLHVIRRLGETLDWQRLVTRFGPHWRVLLAHLVMFGFVYPDQRDQIPVWLTDELSRRLVSEPADPANDVCNGTLVSREQYLHDIGPGGYRDARLIPTGSMTASEIEIWTAPIFRK